MWQRLETIVAVVLITAMIWVFAERHMTQGGEVVVEMQLVGPTPQEHLLVELLDDAGRSRRSVMVKLGVKGPNARIRDLEERRVKPQVPLLDLAKLNIPELEDPEPKVFYRSVVNDLLTRELRLEETETAVQVTKADPEHLAVRVTQLVQRMLPVKVVDLSGAEVLNVEVKPSRINAWVISGEAAEAQAVLSLEQRASAQEDFVALNVTVNGRLQTEGVEVRMAQGQTPPTQMHTIQSPRLGVAMPVAMLGRYQVELAEDPQLREPIQCVGSERSFEEFKQSPYHLLLEVKSEDEATAQKGEPIYRKLRYNFPEDRGDLRVQRDLGLVQFHLKAVRSE